MSKQPMRDVEPARLAEERVVEHLMAHPEFFERHPAVLARLNLPHSAAVRRFPWSSDRCWYCASGTPRSSRSCTS